MIEFVRWYVVAASLVAAIVGTPVLWRRWRGYKIENKYAWLALVALNFAVGYGTAEALWRDIPGGPRNLILGIAETWLLVAVAYHPLEAVRRWWMYRCLTRQADRARRPKD